MREPSPEFRLSFEASFMKPEIIATAESVIAESLREMQASGGSETGMLAVYTHVLGKLASIYQAELEIDALAFLKDKLDASVAFHLPRVLERHAEIRRARGISLVKE